MDKIHELDMRGWNIFGMDLSDNRKKELINIEHEIKVLEELLKES